MSLKRSFKMVKIAQKNLLLQYKNKRVDPNYNPNISKAKLQNFCAKILVPAKLMCRPLETIRSSAYHNKSRNQTIDG